MKQEFRLTIAVILFYACSLFGQSTVNSYTKTLKFFLSDNLQMYEGARIAVPSMTLPNSLTTYTSTLPFGNSDIRQVYNAIRGMGDAVSGFTNISWNTTGNAISTNTNFIGSTTNFDWLLKSNNKTRFKFGSNGINTIYCDSSTFELPFRIEGGSTVNGANPYMQLKGYYIGAYRILNSISGVEWYMQNNTTNGATKDNFFIGTSSNPGLSAIMVSTLTSVNFANKVRIGSLTTLPINTLDVSGTLGVSGAATFASFVTFQNSISQNIQTNWAIQNGVAGSSITIGTRRVDASYNSFQINDKGFVSINGTNPTAALTLPATGSISASTAPLKLTVSGSSVLTTPEVGAIETNASGVLFYTPSASNRYQVGTVLTGTATLDFPVTNGGFSSDLTLTVTGAADGDAVSIGFGNAAQVADGIFYGWVSAANTVTIRYANNSIVTAYNPASATFKATVIKN